MKIMKRFIAAVLVLSMLLVSVNAEELLDLYFDASLDLKTGETTLTPKELDTETDSSDLWVEVTKIAPDGTVSHFYSGAVGEYDNGRWVNIDFSDDKPLMLCDWQTQNCYWVVPAEEPEEDNSAENQNETEPQDEKNIKSMPKLIPDSVEKVFSLPEVDTTFINTEQVYTDDSDECIPQNAQLVINNQPQSDVLTEDGIETIADAELYSTNNFIFNANLLTSFNTITGPASENGANEPKFSYNSFLEENVSDYSGELTLNFEDLVLDGRNGLDLRIGRTYQTVAANVGESTIMVLPKSNGRLGNFLINDYSTYMMDRYNLGVGWSFSFPSVQIETEYIPLEVVDTYYYEEEKELFYHSGNGDVYQVEFTADTTDSNLKGYYNKDIQFNKNDTGYSNGQVTSYYSMTLSDKTKQYFAEDGRLIGIVDRFGNTIKFEHELKSITNRVPQGTFAYNTENNNSDFDFDGDMWISSTSSTGSPDAVRQVNTGIGSIDGQVMRFSRNNANGDTYIISQPIQVKPLTDYELGIRFKSQYSADIDVDIVGYDTAYNLQDEVTLTIEDYPTNTWYDFSDTFSMSSAVRYIQIKISPRNANGMYIDTVKLDDPKPILKKITDSVGRTVEFAYQGDATSGETTGSVILTVTSPDGSNTRTLTYNQEAIQFVTRYLGHGEHRTQWYLNSSNTEGNDGTPVQYAYEGGVTFDSEGNAVYPKLYANYEQKTQLTSDGYNHKPVLNSVKYKDRKKIYEYETVRKNLGDDGYYDTLRIKKKYDKYLYVPEGATKGYFKGEIDVVNYSYSGTYNGNTFNNETGYPNYTFDDETSLNEQWTVTKTGKSTDTVTFSNCAVVQQTSSSGGTSVVSDYTNHSNFKILPTQIKKTVTQNGSSKSTYVLYSYNDWGGVASETKEIDESIKNTAELLEKYTTVYQYEPNFHYITQKSYYNNIDSPQVTEINTFNSNGLLTSSENAVKEKTVYHYENTTYPFLVTKTTIDDPMRFHNLMGGDMVTSYIYDSYGLYPMTISESYDGGTALTSYEYDYISGDILMETLPDDSSTQYTYYQDGKVDLVVSPLSMTEDNELFYMLEKHTYSSNHQIIGYVEDEDCVFSREQVVKYVVFYDEGVAVPYILDFNYYDAVGNLKINQHYCFIGDDGSTIQLKSITKYYHDIHDRLIKTVDSEGNTVTYTYDGFDRPVSVTDSEGNVYNYTYDNVQNKIDVSLNGVSQTADKLLATQYFDLYGNVIQNTVYPTNSTSQTLSESYEYDLNNNLTSFTNANGYKTEYLYDASNRLIETILPNGVKATSSYSVFNEPSFEKIYAADDVEKMARISYRNEKGDLSSRFFNYDGRMTDSDGYDTDEKGRTTVIQEGENHKSIYYDEFDRPLIISSGDSNIQKRYNWFGETISVSNNNDVSSVSYSYDMIGNIAQKLQAGVHSIDYTYSSIGNITQSTMPSERTESYTYTPNGNLDTIATEGKTFDYDYYDTGYVKSITYPNGLKTEYEYDNINRVTRVITTKNGTAINTFEYEYDNNGNTTKEIRNGAVTSYSYDSLDRLISVTYSDGSSVAYEYDALNNRTKETYSTGDVKDYVYNEKYQLKEIKLNGQVTDTFTYNETGAVVTHNNKIFTYNEWDRMSGYSDGTDSYTYKYDANGIRTQKNDKLYIIDINNNVVAETDSTGAVADEILWGHQPLARKVNGTWYYYIYNAHGDVVGLVDDNGNIKNTYTYDPWGNVLSESENIDNPIKYAGEYYDDELGMIYLRARYYNPQIGRFTSLDIEEGEIASPLDMNRYVYCRNNPIKYVDPTGKSAIATAVAIVGPAVIDAAATAIVYGFTGRNIGAGLVNGFVEGLTASVSTYIGGVPGAIIGGTLGSALGSMSEDLLFNKNKSVEEIAKSAAESAAWGLVGGLSSSYIGKAIDIANEAGSAAQTLMKYDERFGKAIKIFFEQLVNILSSQ